MADKVEVKTLKDFFGMKEGQKLADFAAELKELTDAEKIELQNMIKEVQE